MGTIIETIDVTVTGANPHTYTFQVPIDLITGAGSPLSIPLVGTLAGTDTIQASMPSHGYVSNFSEIAWQGVNGAIANSDFTVVVHSNTGQTPGYIGLGTSVLGTITSNSCVYNQVDQNTPINGFNNQPTNIGPGGGYKLIPARFVEQTSAGQFASVLNIPGSGSGSTGNPFVLDMTGYLIVKTPGIYTLWMVFANVTQCAFWIGGGAVLISNGGNNTGSNPFPSTGPNTTFWNAQSPSTNHLMGANNVNPGLFGGTRGSWINFPTAGVYPIEIYHNQRNPIQFSGDNNGYFQITYGAGQQNQQNNEGDNVPGTPTFFPVTKANAPPAGTPGTAQLRLSPTGGAANLQLQGASETLTLTFQNVAYTTVPYIPILEGTAGSLNITGVHYAQSVDNPTAAAASFTLSGDNTAFSGLLTVTSAAGSSTSPTMTLNYNGGPIVAHVDETNLLITAKDVAFFRSSDKTYDVFPPTGSGNLQFAIVVDWLANPSPFVSGVSPLTHAADGSQVQFTVSLTKPISPQQQGTALGTGNTIGINVAWSGGIVTNTITPIISGGWLTGWFVNATLPVSSSTITATMNVTIQGNLARLAGTAIVTNNFVYVNNVQVATITLTGVALTPPVEYAFSVAPPGPAYVDSQAITITATVYNKTNVSNTVTFLRRQNGTTTQATMGTSSVPTSSTTGVVGGQTVFIKTYQLATTTVAFYPSTNLGFSCVDQNSLAMTPVFWSPTVYTHTTSGGGGGGGCPEVGMYVGSGKQVRDVTPGYILDTLQGETPDYIKGLPLCEPAEVMQLDFSDEDCFRLIAENGAEVIVSASTPVATREAITAIAEGVDAGSVAAYANQVRAGMHVITNVGGGPEWSMLAETQAVGRKRVARLYCGGRNFAAGVKPGKYIYTHNVQPIVK